MLLDEFLNTLRNTPESIEFTDTMAVIESEYEFSPTSFKNGTAINAADQNQGSCKLLAFAQIHQLTQAQTLACFGKYYREDVLNNPDGGDHQNIRSFMHSGWEGVEFTGQALKPVS
jgi:HopJ type III effector protein